MCVISLLFCLTINYCHVDNNAPQLKTGLWFFFSLTSATSGQVRGVDKPCPPCPYYGKIKEKYGGSTYDDADGQ